MAVAEAGGDDLGGGGDGHIEHHGLVALLPESGGEDLRGVLGAAVHAGVGDHHAVLLRGVGAPLIIFIQEGVQILPPHEAVEGADHLQRHVLHLAEEVLDLGAVLAHDVGVVPAGLVHVIPLKVHLVGKDGAVKGAEGAEGVGGEEDLVGLVVGHHDLGPVDHGGHDEGQLVTAGVQHVPLLHDPAPVGDIQIRELADHGGGLGVADHGGLGIPEQQLRERGGMVRLHVLDDYIIQSPAVQGVGHIFKKHLADGLVHRVQQHGNVVQQQIGVIGHARGHGIHALEHGQTPVVAAYPHQVGSDLFRAIHE